MDEGERSISLATFLRQRFPSVDIRSDQCDLVRMYAGKIMAGCKHDRDRYEAKVFSLDGDMYDISVEPELLAHFVENSPEDLADKLAKFV